MSLVSCASLQSLGLLCRLSPDVEEVSHHRLGSGPASGSGAREYQLLAHFLLDDQTVSGPTYLGQRMIERQLDWLHARPNSINATRTLRDKPNHVCPLARLAQRL